ncbi:prepilin-type N-terminal cleavage/methylation domain-containing protein [Ruminococcus sp.]|uniref:PilW family protein n=1 Tax=Ruminococcus sp. TaxID=41978 RepID=UPI0025E06D4B|nr:prepilin-type N-terminal cleavage/methylation domain-containing protein [Ruminococcus sp.]MBQ9541030.1 prepilin-type N-terminal cleavage/methylation domain-containing protein [Ruminococcus sp.]
MKNNKKGFTLVELIIVSTIMVMIMGAILNFIQPMNKFYTRTVYNSDANDVGSLLQDKVEADVRYATNICILEDYEGVPVIKDHYLRKIDGTKAVDSFKFTNVIIIDNNSFRGKIFETYSEDNTVAHRKGATGSILRAPINDDGIDMDKLEILGGEELYSDMKCEFETYLSVDDSTKNKCLTLSSKFWRPEYTNGQYEFNKMIFNQVRDFELVNVNLKDDRYKKYEVNYFTTRTDASDPTKYQAYQLDYNQFAKETAGSYSQGINEMYAATDDKSRNLSFTYIFYTKSVPDTSKVKITCKYQEGFPLYGASLNPEVEINSGSTIPTTYINSWKSEALNKTTSTWSDGTDTYILTFDDFYIDDTVPYSTVKDDPVMNDIDLVIHYTKRKLLPPNYHVYFYDQFDSSGNWLGAPNSDPYKIVPIYNPSTADGDEYLDETEVSIPSGDEVHEFDSWNTMPDGSGYAPDFTTSITSDTSFYAIYKEPAVLTFKDENDAELDPSGDGDVVTIRHSATGNEVTISSDFKTSPEIQAFINSKTAAKKTITWKVYDSSDNYVADLETMSSFPDTENNFWVKPELGDMPEGLNITSLGAPTLNWGVVEYPITISNASSDNLYIKTMTVNFPSSFALDSYYCYDENYRNSYGTISAGASSATITFQDNIWNAPMVPANGTLSVKLQLKRGNPNQIDPNHESASAYELSIGDVTVDETFTG